MGFKEEIVDNPLIPFDINIFTVKNNLLITFNNIGRVLVILKANLLVNFN
jgi:hypothetical protein